MMISKLGHKIVTVMWIMTLSPLVFLTLRLYCRIHYRKSVSWDDYIIAVSWVVFAGYTSVITASIFTGLGQHYDALTESQYKLTMQLISAGQILAIFSCVWSRTSFAVTLLHVVVGRNERMILWFMIISMNIAMTLDAIFYFVQCEHPAHLWDPSISSKCWEVSVFTSYSIFAGAYSAAQDFFLALFPWVIVWNLQMKKREKFGVACAMSLGLFAGITACIKTKHLTNLSHQIDYTFYSADVLIWASCEIGLTIIAASIPHLRPLVKGVLTVRSNTRSSEGSRGNVASYELSHTEASPSVRPDAHSFHYRTRISVRSKTNGDGESERSILGQPGWSPHSGITQTKEVKVESCNGFTEDICP